MPDWYAIKLTTRISTDRERIKIASVHTTLEQAKKQAAIIEGNLPPRAHPYRIRVIGLNEEILTDFSGHPIDEPRKKPGKNIPRGGFFPHSGHG